ncbi:MAG TPA: YihY/virulence factor BrkB family protein [Ktedonobacterales bacterium]|nr:YihY/virulence factor BrkB family protein [Ktedonobacterales bacterium]
MAGMARQLGRFWIKINRDWMFNLAGMLSYNLLLSIFPLLILSISLLGIIFQHSTKACSSSQFEGQIITNLASFLPSQITGAHRERGGATSITTLCATLSHDSFTLAAFGIITGLWFGSRLFVKLENTLGVIFRLRSRSFWQQNTIALGMTILFAVLGPLSVLVTFAPEHFLLPLGGLHALSTPVGKVIGWVCGTVIAFLLIELIYVVVPNQRVRPQDVWRGASVAAVLLSAYELVFPLYAHFISTIHTYGAIAGLMVILLLFFYYFAVILLLGAEINSWYLGYTEPSGDIATILSQSDMWKHQRQPMSQEKPGT